MKYLLTMAGKRFDEPLFQACLNAFYQKGEDAIKVVCNCRVPSMVVLDRYKSLPPMPDEERKELIQYAAELFPGWSGDRLEQVAKIVYTIGNSL